MPTEESRVNEVFQSSLPSRRMASLSARLARVLKMGRPSERAESESAVPKDPPNRDLRRIFTLQPQHKAEGSSAPELMSEAASSTEPSRRSQKEL